MAFCQCNEQSLKRQNNSCYSDPNFPEADSLSKDTQSVQPCGVFFFYFILFLFFILPPKNVKNVCVPLYMYRMNVWICVRVSLHIQSWCEVMLLLKLAGP